MTRRRATIIVSVVAAAMFFVQAMIVFAPKQERPSSVDVILVLAPTEYRIAQGIALLEAGYSDTLVLSSDPAWTEWDPCRDAEFMAAYAQSVVCFSPVPETTEGEALTFRHLAAEREWDSAIVVTDRTHLSRSRYLFETCAAPVDTSFVMAERHRDPLGWAYAFIYETGAWFKVAVTPSC